MRWTTLLHQHAKATTASRTSTAPSRRLKSLALSVYFKQPDFGMKEYEILSRATAFLLGVDAPSHDGDGDSSSAAKGPYAHLEAAQQRREKRQFQHAHKYSYVSGGEDREFMDIGWLEYVPREYRPQVHVVASSHVLAPYLWQDYYPHDWLKHVRAEHCTYSLEVYDPAKPKEALAKFALNKDIFHHPEGRDIALIHFQEEQSSLNLLKRLGVNILHLRDKGKLYQKGEDMFFDGFVVSEQNPTDREDFRKEMEASRSSSSSSSDGDEANEDRRIFYPYREDGKLSFHTNDRFFANTSEPLPEGLCGAPVLDGDGDLCGTVEGIVPVDHKDKRLAGSAAFMPSHVMKDFIDYVERGLLEQMMPRDLFRMVVTAKSTNTIGGVFGTPVSKEEGGVQRERNLEETYDAMIETLKQHYRKEEIDKILKSVEDQRKEVLEIFDREGGDLDEIVHRVRSKAMQIREMVQDQFIRKMSEDAPKS